MPEPGDSLDLPADRPNASASQPDEGLAASSGDSAFGDMMGAMIELQRQVEGDSRLDRRSAGAAQAGELRAKAARLDAENESIETGMAEAREKANHAMTSAMTALVIGIITTVAAIFAGIFLLGGQAGNPAADISSLWRQRAGSLPAGIGGVSNPLPSSPGSDGETLDSRSPSSSKCAISFIHLPLPGDVPTSGPFTFNWDDVPGAAAYSVRILQPGGSGAPWIIPMEGTSKTIYLENFPAGGEYEVSVSALSTTQEVLCAAAFRFNKDESDSPARLPNEERGEEGGAASCFNPNNPGVCP